MIRWRRHRGSREMPQVLRLFLSSGMAIRGCVRLYFRCIVPSVLESVAVVSLILAPQVSGCAGSWREFCTLTIRMTVDIEMFQWAD